MRTLRQLSYYDPGYDPHLAVGVALADSIGARPDLDHAPDEPEHEHDAQRAAKPLLQGGGSACGLSQKGGEDGFAFARKGSQ